MAIRRHGAGATVTREAFRARMESQCHQIEQYRKRILRETGRDLTLDEAAVEWIEQYAATFQFSDEASCA